MLEEIRRELGELRESYGDKRRTEIIPETHDISIEDMIADEPMVITVTQSGYVKRSPLSLYRAQARGGKGRTGMVTKDDDFVEHLYVATAHSYILVFTESGRMHWLKVHEIPEAGPTAQRQGDRQPAQPGAERAAGDDGARCASSATTATSCSPRRTAR